MSDGPFFLTLRRFALEKQPWIIITPIIALAKMAVAG
jgi:hypothetical protein